MSLVRSWRRRGRKNRGESEKKVAQIKVENVAQWIVDYYCIHRVSPFDSARSEYQLIWL